MVYVLNVNNEPLMPCNNTIARLLLKQGKAKVKFRTPFTIKLTYEATNYRQELTHGVDTGSAYIGSAVVSKKQEVIYVSQIEIRNDITDKMKHRSIYRRNRRYRKARYRKARWRNRKNSIKKDRFSSTMISKINSHLKEINFVKSILPISKLILETATFDTCALKNPSVLNNKWLYQRGVNYGYANTKSYVLTRDNYTCQQCKGKLKDVRVEVHHIIFRSNGGSDEQENLITLCIKCHDNVHNGSVKLKLNGKSKGQLKHATQMNSIRVQLLNKLDCIETFGYVTKEHRQLLNLPKEHYMDAIVIACQGKFVNFTNNAILFKKCISSGDYQQSQGVRSEKRIPTCKINGFRKFDKVKYLGNEYFIKGRMSTGYAILMDITGAKIEFRNVPKGMKTPKMVNMKRVSSRKSWIISEKIIQNPY